MNEEKIYNQFMSGEITITLDDETARKARECFGFDEMHAEYEFIKNALEKQIPKKPLRDRRKYFDNVNCKCGYRFFSVDETGIFAGQKSNFCPDCGQRLDWSGEK